MHRCITYVLIIKCTVNYLLIMPNKHIFNEKYKNITYTMQLNVKAELIKWLSAYIKIWLKVHFKQPLWKTFTVHSFILFHECPLGGGSGFGSWRGWLIIWRWKWLGSSTKLPGGLDFHLMKRRALGEELWETKEHLSNKVLLKSEVWIDLWHILPEKWIKLGESEDITHNSPNISRWPQI